MMCLAPQFSSLPDVAFIMFMCLLGCFLVKALARAVFKVLPPNVYHCCEMVNAYRRRIETSQSERRNARFRTQWGCSDSLLPSRAPVEGDFCETAFQMLSPKSNFEPYDACHMVIQRLMLLKGRMWGRKK